MTSEARQRKMADRIKVIVAETLEKRIKDPRLGFITVTDVRVTPDIREASVFYTVYGDEEARAVHGRGAGVRQGRAAHRGRHARPGSSSRPSLAFFPDAIPETAAHLEELLAAAAVADAAVHEQAATATYAGDADPYRHPDDDEAADDGVTASGILVVDKPGGMTSHDVVGRVRRILGTRKVGHAGTLDPHGHGRPGGRGRARDAAAGPPRAAGQALPRHDPTRCRHGDRRRGGRRAQRRRSGGAVAA